MAEEIALGFACGADIEGLGIIGVEGREWIHRHFEADLVLARFGTPLSLEEINTVVGSRAVLALGEEERDRLHGVIESIVHLDCPRTEMQVYVARMAPEASLLSRGRRSTVYQNLSVPELVEQLLTTAGLVKGETFELRVNAESPKREYIVQYQESDWDFLARWLEHEGMFSMLEHFGDRSMLVITDKNESTPALEPAAIAYRGANNLSSGGATLWNVQMRDRQVPRVVSVVDYNYRRPDALIVAAHQLAVPAFGHVALYGDHFKDDAEALVIARLRGEEVAADRRVLSATTDRTALRCGYRFELENHYHAEYDGVYLVTECTFAAGNPVPRGPNVHEMSTEAVRYSASFAATPVKTPFRPSRKVEWPSIHGVLHGHIQGDSSGQAAEIDELGRYKVRMPFDLATKPGLAASRWVRKAQPYAGAGYGMHFPLHKGTEVLIAHLDGDPDRPIIVGAVPHATTPSPVTAGNATQSVIQSATGIRIEMEDNQA
jgi:type VI secretion system secreted protein VgrG